MGYPGTMTTRQLRWYGFVIQQPPPGNPPMAVSELYPNLSARWQCSKCGNWSQSHGNGKDFHCPQCFTRKKPLKSTRQHWKLYLCCDDGDCPTWREAMALLKEYRIEVNGIGGIDTSSDGTGSYVDMSGIEDLPLLQLDEFFDRLNMLSVSKRLGRKLNHPGSKDRSKLPKRK